jgi:hypothetical protein
MDDFWRAMKIVFSEKKYVFLALAVAIFFYLINVLILNFGNLRSFGDSFGFLESLGFFITLILGFWKSIEFHSLVTTIVVSIFLGIFVSMVYYKAKLKVYGKKKIGKLGIFGVLLGSLAPGCAACGIGLASALGLGGVILTVLPYQGLELSALAIGLLGFAIYKTGKDLMDCEECKVKFKNV